VNIEEQTDHRKQYVRKREHSIIIKEFLRRRNTLTSQQMNQQLEYMIAGIFRQQINGGEEPHRRNK
jgi:hypothetical protein